MSDMIIFVLLSGSFAVTGMALIVMFIVLRRNKVWINRFVAMQNVSLYLYNRLEMIDHNIHHRMREKGADTLDDDHRMAQHHAEQRNDVAHVAYNGLIFIDPVTKDAVL